MASVPPEQPPKRVANVTDEPEVTGTEAEVETEGDGEAETEKE